MAKLKLEFDLDEEELAYRDALNGANYRRTVDGILEQLQYEIKNERTKPAKRKMLTGLQREILEFMNDLGLPLP